MRNQAIAVERNISAVVGSRVVSSASGNRFHFAYNLKHSKIMSKQTEKQQQASDATIERFTFAMLVVMVVNGQLAEFLADKTADDRAYLAHVWDTHKSVPIGTLFSQPDFL